MIAKLKMVNVLALVAAVCTMVVACSPAGVGGDPDATPTASGGISVEKKILDVEVTLPASFFGEMTADQIQAKAAEAGYTAKVDADGTVTYTIPKILHQKLITDMGKNIDASIAKTLASEDSVADIAHNAQLTSFRMTVDQTAFESSISASFIPFGLGMQAMFYQAFDGVAQPQRRVVVTYVDATTGDEFDTYILPDALE